MTRRPRLLAQPAGEALAYILGTQLDAIAGATSRLGNRRDTEALHDFRVAVRRLRSALRAYRPWLGRVASRAIRARWRALSRATGAGRDAEVQRAWLDAQRATLPPDARAALRRLLASIGAGENPPVPSVRGDAEAAIAQLHRRLTHHTPATEPFAPAFGQVLAEHAGEAVTCRAAVGSSADAGPAHRTRIALKRLRYVLEPVAREMEGGRPLVGRLKRLQDHLGTLHDAHVMDALLGTLPAGDRAAIGPLAARNRTRLERAFAAFRRAWPDDLVLEVRRLGAERG